MNKASSIVHDTKYNENNSNRHKEPDQLVNEYEKNGNDIKIKIVFLLQSSKTPIDLKNYHNWKKRV